jgi:WD40 repeat protein
MMNCVSQSIFCLFVIVATLGSPAAFSQTGYHLMDEKFSVLGGGELRALTSDNGELFLSLGAEVVVIDALKGDERGRIADTPGVSGVAIDPFSKLGFTINAGDNTVTVFDVKTLKPVGTKVRITKTPLSIVFDPMTERILALSDETTVIDGRNGKNIGTIQLGTRPGAAGADNMGNVFVTLPEKRRVAIVDPAKLALTQEFEVSSCNNPHTISLDTENQRLFVGCDQGRLAILQFKNGKIAQIASLKKICNDIRTAGFDSTEDLFFATCAEGAISFVQAHDAGKFEKVGQNVATPLGANLMTFAAGENKRIFLGGPAAPQGSKPGSISVLIVAR